MQVRCTATTTHRRRHQETFQQPETPSGSPANTQKSVNQSREVKGSAQMAGSTRLCLQILANNTNRIQLHAFWLCVGWNTRDDRDSLPG
jgi:hypothetical protein